MRKKLFILITSLLLLFAWGCSPEVNSKTNPEIYDEGQKDGKDLDHLYEKEIQFLNSLVSQENDECYVKEDIINNIQKIYIDNEKLLVMGRNILISEVNEILPVKNVVKVDSTYIVYFQMENEKFIILCDEHGIIDNMFFIKDNIISSDYYMGISDENMKKETLQNFGYFYHLTPLILDEKQEELDYPFYELVFSDGIIYHFYVGNNSNDFIITSYKSVNNKINKKIMDYLLKNN